MYTDIVIIIYAIVGVFVFYDIEHDGTLENMYNTLPESNFFSYSFVRVIVLLGCIVFWLPVELVVIFRLIKRKL
jgi:hypothetical protein